jgi:hypothetical protein
MQPTGLQCSAAVYRISVQRTQRTKSRVKETGRSNKCTEVKNAFTVLAGGSDGKGVLVF